MVNEEKDALLAALNDQREHVLGALDGLSEEDLRRPVLPSAWTPLGMVRHLALGGGPTSSRTSRPGRCARRSCT